MQKNVAPPSAATAQPPRAGWLRYAPAREGYALAGRLLPWFWAAAGGFGVAGLAFGLLFAPSDFVRGDAYRIVFVQLPAAWMSVINWLSMTLWAALGLALNTRPSFMLASALAPTGTVMTFLALWSGALWGKPASGQWWTWSAPLSAELLLLGLYVAFIALQAASADPRRGERAGAVLALVGSVKFPLVYFMVREGEPADAGATLDFTSVPAMDGAVLAGTLLMVAAFWAWCAAVALHRFRSILLEREAGADWVLRLGEVSRVPEARR